MRVHFTEYGSARELLTGAYGGLETEWPGGRLRHAALREHPAAAVERAEQSVVNVTDQRGTESRRERLRGPDDTIARTQTARIFINLRDEFIVTQLDDLAEETFRADAQRLVQVERAMHPGPQDRAADPANLRLAHAPTAPAPERDSSRNHSRSR
jgi:hypothetical protein